MKAKIVEQIELFSEAELESLEFVPEELEAIEEELVPDLESISFEDIAEDLEAVLETNPTDIMAQSEAISSPGYIRRGNQIAQLSRELNNMNPFNPRRLSTRRQIRRLQGERDAIVTRYQNVAQQLQQLQQLQQQPPTPLQGNQRVSTLIQDRQRQDRINDEIRRRSLERQREARRQQAIQNRERLRRQSSSGSFKTAKTNLSRRSSSSFNTAKTNLSRRSSSSSRGGIGSSRRRWSSPPPQLRRLPERLRSGGFGSRRLGGASS